MHDLEGKLKLLLLFIVCGGIVYSFWQTLEKGGKIIALGKEKPSHLQETLPRPLPEPPSPPEEIHVDSRRKTFVPERRSSVAAPQAQASVRNSARARSSRRNYTFSVTSAFQKDRDEMLLSGRVAGPDCQFLRLSISAKSSEGKRVVATATVDDIRSGSRLFKTRARATYRSSIAPPRWEITEISAFCQDLWKVSQRAPIECLT